MSLRWIIWYLNILNILTWAWWCPVGEDGGLSQGRSKKTIMLPLGNKQHYTLGIENHLTCYEYILRLYTIPFCIIIEKKEGKGLFVTCRISLFVCLFVCFLGKELSWTILSRSLWHVGHSLQQLHHDHHDDHDHDHDHRHNHHVDVCDMWVSDSHCNNCRSVFLLESPPVFNKSPFSLNASFTIFYVFWL